MREFFDADEAAVELQRLTQLEWTAAQVLRQTKAGRLPVCFDFAGELVVHSVDGKPEPGGKSPRVLDFDGVIRSLTQPNAGGLCGFGVLVEIQEAHSLKFSHKDGILTRGIELPTEFSHGGRIKAGHKVECWIEDADICVEDFLFHSDDLTKLVSDAQAAPTPLEVVQGPEVTQQADKNQPLPLTTGDIAFCFADIRWSEKQWRKPLGDKPNWLKSCIAIPGQQGVSQIRWNPVLIALALVNKGYAQARTVRARFQKQPLLLPWLDKWKTYEADYLDDV